MNVRYKVKHVLRGGYVGGLGEGEVASDECRVTRRGGGREPHRGAPPEGEGPR